MSHDIKIPSVGESVLEVTIASWSKKDGDLIEQGDELLILETDKASVEIIAEHAGVLRILKPKGETLPVGSLVGSLEPASDEMIKKLANQKKEAKEIDKAPETQESSKAPAISKPESLSKPSEAYPALKASVAVTPSKLKLQNFPPAKRHRILNQKEDFPDNQQQAFGLKVQNQQTQGHRITKVPMSHIRRTIALRLKQVQNTAAILTTFNEVDLTETMTLRQQYQEEFVKKYGVKLGLMSLFVKACIEGLKAYPLLNGYLQEDDLIIQNHFYNIGVAVSTPRGLMVPVLKDADQMSLADIEIAIKEVAQKARDGKISIDDLSEGTFTITNGGVFGSMLSTPILNPPQSGILGMHAINKRPMAIDGEVKIRSIMYLALSYDHRIVDGREAVGFLVTVKKSLEDIRRLLLFHSK